MANSARLSAESSTEPSTSIMSKPPLLSLSAELRNKIWEYALQQPEPIDIMLKRSNSMQLGGLMYDKTPGEMRVAALLRVCHQTQTECSQMLYALNIFRFTIHPSLLVRPQHDLTWIYGRFLDSIGALQKKSLRQVLVNVALTESSIPSHQTQDYLTSLHERSAEIPLQSLRCVIVDGSSPMSVEIDVLDLARSRANAIRQYSAPFSFRTPVRAFHELRRSILRQSPSEKIKQELEQQKMNDPDQVNDVRSHTAIQRAQNRPVPGHNGNTAHKFRGQAQEMSRARHTTYDDEPPRRYGQHQRRARSSRDNQARYQAPYQRRPDNWRPRGSRY